MPTKTAVTGHADPTWLARLSDLLPPNPCTYECFPAGHTRLSNQLCPDTLASFPVGQMPRQGSTLWHIYSAYQRQPMTMILKKSLSHREPGKIFWGATDACLPCLRLCLQNLLLALFEKRNDAGQISGLDCHSHSWVLTPWWQLDIFHAH